MAEDKIRLDLLLVERGLFPSREKARAAIMAGQVLASGLKIEKPGTLVPRTADIKLIAGPGPYVGRGGIKLAHALKNFGVDLKGKVVLDAGASTGGFTDCALKHGAARVYAVDVGYGQLAWELREDPRVVVRERTNLRYLTPEALGEKVDLATLDLSFISLAKVLPAVIRLLKDDGQIIALIKPQFEAGRERLGKKGVVRDPALHREILREVLTAAQGEGLVTLGLTYSPIAGPEGNIEFFAWLGQKPVKEALAGEALEERIEAVVAEAWAKVKRKLVK
ncbi:MAG: rRNA (cytidine1920-2-O)/16S rRNA (cytidine1409-2-O)-methyltransferase [Clostridia bacterium]|nr:rRNA (cytidine1920-2-O)/16S rRNA (cytidine1409-2-O)-methyltransferase [Clostridia bacterium]